ncbi:MAG: radical SAM protein [Candidatus Diapherotrites archaeon]|nr:radical SAM protein [Candidatus Diapherotrites archaeon]
MSLRHKYKYYKFQIKRFIKRFILSPYATPRKFVNMLLLTLQYATIKPAKVIGYPLKLTIDPTNVCQLRCPLCPTGQRRRGRKKGYMKFSEFKKIVDEMAPYLYEIDLNNWGEPFLNKEIFKMIEYAHSKKIWLSVNTNFNVPLTEKQAERLVKSGLDQLYLSIDGITQKTYEKYRVGGKLKTVIENIKLINKKKKELNSETPRIVWQFLVNRYNEHEVPKLKEFQHKYGIDKLVIGALRTSMADEIFLEDREKIELIKDWLPKNEKFSRYDYRKKERKLKKKYCHFLWFVSVINWNGSVSPCCGVYFEKYDFGNALKEGFKKVWNNEKYQAARNAVARRKYKIETVCVNCLRTGFMD